MHRNPSVQVALQEVDPYVEVAVEAEVPPEVRQEVEPALVIEDEGVPGEEDEVEASVLEEGVEGLTQISRDLALVGEDHSLSGLALRPKAFFVRETYPNPVVSMQNSSKLIRILPCTSTLTWKT